MSFIENNNENGRSIEPLASVAGPMTPITLARGRDAVAGRKPKLLHEDMHDHVATPEPRGPKGRVSRTLVNFWLDGALAVAFVALCVAAVIVHFVFPPGVAARDWSLWGLTYGQWCSIQFTLIAVLALGVLVHVMLHWPWVCSVFARRILHRKTVPDDGIRTVYGVGLLICLMMFGAVVVGMAQWMIVRPA